MSEPLESVRRNYRRSKYYMRRNTAIVRVSKSDWISPDLAAREGVSEQLKFILSLEG